MRSRPGVSLFEVVITIVVLGIGLLPLAGALAAFARYAAGAAWDERTARVADDRIGDARFACGATPVVIDTLDGRVVRASYERAGPLTALSLRIESVAGATPRARDFRSRHWCAAPSP